MTAMNGPQQTAVSRKELWKNGTKGISNHVRQDTHGHILCSNSAHAHSIVSLISGIANPDRQTIIRSYSRAGCKQPLRDNYESGGQSYHQ